MKTVCRRLCHKGLHKSKVISIVAVIYIFYFMRDRLRCDLND
jgi:hypothetical protein